MSHNRKKAGKKNNEKMRELTAILRPHYANRSYKSAISERELQRRLSLIPPDTRDLTGRAFGDPIPNDRRRPWLCKNTTNVNSAENSH